jgi:hypothetical protein
MPMHLSNSLQQSLVIYFIFLSLINLSNSILFRTAAATLSFNYQTFIFLRIFKFEHSFAGI